MRFAALFICLALPAFAQPAETAARDAMAQLQAAQLRLQTAGDARDQIAALTQTVQAYEAGLAAARSGMRQLHAQEAALAADLDTRRAAIGALVGTLATISKTPAPVSRSQPQTPIETARAGMLAAEVTQALQAAADDLGAQIAQLQALQALQQDTAVSLTTGMQSAQSARAALGQAISARTDLPKSFDADPVQAALLMSGAQSLAGFADALAETLPDSQRVLTAQGNLPLPVAGIVQPQGRGEDGVYIATAPQALVLAPVEGTILYVGPLLGDLNVVIIEPAPDVVFIFAGLAQLFGKAGEIVPAGTPLGVMGGNPSGDDSNLSENTDEDAQAAAVPLYLEVRDGQSSVSPDAWFALE
ncbi:Septal ring factor EnvC, activator of murein hydrolases AmiA and AmiB [Yoonia tamlensis]|uniref:Septal ring factor EnvC, activator of murein hydrolases AmiA and AmiB n=1 Tax=Yoonia tamlensis TaxID=390270 RepID=A0A1I6FPB3_9RHOB|nr:peptidoglycan DD-metalloendopeptidase family protein [Yoonia tamlensis]SFR31738.1 Septal ring factor EnvC, activator of murein hydrolases AmiA and AmiB [Yoonia tamlensis]